LRHRPAAGLAVGADLHLRVHILRVLRRERVARRLPQLRWRVRTPSDPPEAGGATRALPRPATRLHHPAPPLLRPGRDRPVPRPTARPPPRRGVALRGAPAPAGAHPTGT